MKLLNRSALSVRPTRHFVDWINALEPTMGEDDLTLADVEHESTVYLIPEMDTPEALEAFVRERYLEILETELRAWEEDERQWPEALGASVSCRSSTATWRSTWTTRRRWRSPRSMIRYCWKPTRTDPLLLLMRENRLRPVFSLRIPK